MRTQNAEMLPRPLKPRFRCPFLRSLPHTTTHPNQPPSAPAATLAPMSDPHPGESPAPPPPYKSIFGPADPDPNRRAPLEALPAEILQNVFSHLAETHPRPHARHFPARPPAFPCVARPAPRAHAFLAVALVSRRLRTAVEEYARHKLTAVGGAGGAVAAGARSFRRALLAAAAVEHRCMLCLQDFGAARAGEADEHYDDDDDWDDAHMDADSDDGGADDGGDDDDDDDDDDSDSDLMDLYGLDGAVRTFAPFQICRPCRVALPAANKGYQFRDANIYFFLPVRALLQTCAPMLADHRVPSAHWCFKEADVRAAALDFADQGRLKPRVARDAARAAEKLTSDITFYTNLHNQYRAAGGDFDHGEKAFRVMAENVAWLRELETRCKAADALRV